MRNRIKLILVVPPQYGLLEGFVNGLICLANYVTQNLAGVSVDLLNLSSTHAQLTEKAIRKACIRQPYEHLVVGVTTLTAFYQSALHVAKTFKDIVPECTVVFGGHHASADAETVLRNHSETVDFVITGEGEKALVEFLIKLETPNVYETRGLAYLRGEDFHQNPSPRFLGQDELDSIPITYRDEGVLGTPGKFGHTTLITARGCPHRCAFCAVANERIRTKSIGQVVSDILELRRKGYTNIAIEDNFFAHSLKRTDELCGALEGLQRRGLRFTWDCQTRVESMMRTGVIDRLAAAGCQAVYLGVESLCPDHLFFLRKTTNPSRYIDCVYEVVRRLLDSPVDCYINIQFGLPGETAEHNEHTHRVLSNLGELAHAKGRVLTIFPQLYVVYPGTQHFLTGLEKGVFPRNVFETFTSWEVSQTPILVWLGEHFAHGTGGLPQGILEPEPLRAGAYEVNPEAVTRISNALRVLNHLKGIKIFDYKDHLTNEVGFSRMELPTPHDTETVMALTERSLV